MLSLHTNAASLSTMNALGANNKALSSSMTKLGTGFRINSAMDDAAGLQIANRLKAQNSGMKVAMRNTQNATSLMQTAEGALNEVNTMLVRMKDLATQSADASASKADKEAMQAEYDSLASEITNIMGNTTFGGEKLMNKAATAADKAGAEAALAQITADLGAEGTFDATGATAAPTAAGTGLGDLLTTAKNDTAVAKKAYDDAVTAGTGQAAAAETWKLAVEAQAVAQKDFDDKQTELDSAQAYVDSLAASPTGVDGKFATELKFQIGATSEETMSLNLSNSLTDLHTALAGISDKYTSFGAPTTVAAGTELTADGSANTIINDLQNVLDIVGALRSDLGAASNRLQHTNANLGNMSTSTEAAIGRVMDVDYASETANMTKNQMLMQASSAMLKQSNSMSQMVASLLQ